jgi:hypothetical protein
MNRHARTARAVLAILVIIASVTSLQAARDRRKPTVTITFPTTGTTILGTTIVSGIALDNIAVAKVDVSIDSGPFSAAIGLGSWLFTWDTTKVPDGLHSVTARATDTSGLTSTTFISITVANNPTGSGGGTQGGSSAAGSIPYGLPNRFSVGLYEDDITWMRDSGVRWDMRYKYFTYGWVNNWGWGAYDGGWGLDYLNQSASYGMTPVVQYYVMNGLANYDESAFLTTAQNAAMMAEYFNEWKVLMQRTKEFAKPTVILVEADGFGFLEQYTGDNSNTYAAVAATGMPELAGLPNTVAGWGLAFLKIRAAVGASNAILAMDISDWATGKDLLYFSVTDSLGPEVDKAYGFLAPLGLGPNVTGQTWDLLANNPLDRDSAYYTTIGQNRWWDASDTASISSRSFNRYAEWLRLWNVKAGKRWMLWQVPLGNSNHLNVYNNGNPREGYADNRPEYFFANGGDAHRQVFAQDGVIGILFGPGTGGMSYFTNDVYTDGQLFMKSRAGAFLNSGGLTIN